MGLQLGANSVYAREKGLITAAQFAILQQVRFLTSPSHVVILAAREANLMRHGEKRAETKACFWVVMHWAGHNTGA